MDLMSMSYERVPYFKDRVLKIVRKTLFDLMYPDTHPLHITVAESDVVENSLRDVSHELTDVFKELVEPYDNELRRVCLQLAVESIDSNKEYHNPASIIQRAKMFEQYVYGTLPETKEDSSTSNQE